MIGKRDVSAKVTLAGKPKPTGAANAASLNKLIRGMDAKLQRIEGFIAQTERTLARK